MSEGSTTTGLFYTSHVPAPSSGQEPTSPEEFNGCDISSFFDVDGTLSWIRENNFSRVALQFPDSLLGAAVPVAQTIERSFEEVKVFVLADTSYRSCCVDTVAAAHASCDSLVHYGEACLSAPTDKLPVKYVLGRLPLDLVRFESAVSEALQSCSEEEQLVLLTDSSYAYAIGDILERIRAEVLPCMPVLLGSDNADKDISLGRVLPAGFREASSVRLLFVGDTDSALLPLWLLTHPQCTNILHFQPKTGEATSQESSAWRGLRRRLFLVEKLRDAHTIGVVIGTVGVASHKEAVQRVRSLAKQRGKKVYVISVGKVNVAKLANFSADVDCFVLLSCSFGVLLDTSDFDKPVLSLFEAEIALNPQREWHATAGWTAEFGNFVHDPLPSKKASGDAEEEADVSLVSGRVRGGQTMREESEQAGEQGGVVAQYTAADYFKMRSWLGLDDSVRQSEEAAGKEAGDGESLRVHEGRKGRAAGYENEPNEPEKKVSGEGV